MAVSQIGTAVIWGITTTGMNKNGTLITNSDKLRHSSQSVARATGNMEHLDGNGEVVGNTCFNQTQDFQIECYPSGDTLSAARTLRNALPVPGERVQLVDAVDTANPMATECLCMSSDYRVSNSDKVIFSMTLKRWANITNYAPITT